MIAIDKISILLTLSFCFMMLSVATRHYLNSNKPFLRTQLVTKWSPTCINEKKENKWYYLDNFVRINLLTKKIKLHDTIHIAYQELDHKHKTIWSIKNSLNKTVFYIEHVYHPAKKGYLNWITHKGMSFNGTMYQPSILKIENQGLPILFDENHQLLVKSTNRGLIVLLNKSKIHLNLSDFENFIKP